MAILLVLALMAVFADVLAPFDENFANISKTLASPGLREHPGHGQLRTRRLEPAAVRGATDAPLRAAVRRRRHRDRPARGPDRRLLRRQVRGRLQLDCQHPDEPPGPDRAADHPGGLRPVGVDRHDRVRRPDQPFLLPPDALSRAVGPQRALRGCRPRVRALRPADHHAPHLLRGPRPHHHPDRGDRRCGHRHPVRARIPGPGRPRQGNVGRDALRGLQERLPHADAALLARVCHGADHRRPGPAGQRHPRRPGRRRKDQAPQEGRQSRRRARRRHPPPRARRASPWPPSTPAPSTTW